MPRASDAKRMTVEEYLKFEETAQIKHEFVDGFVFAMAGASEEHNLICINLASLLRAAVRGSSCSAYVSDMKLQVEDRFYYPDLLLSCDDEDKGKSIKAHPCLIIEVLSKSTSDIDRGEKLYQYRKLSSLKAYVLISQDKRFIEIYRSQQDGSWRYETLEEGTFTLPCLDLSLKLDDVYEDVSLS